MYGQGQGLYEHAKHFRLNIHACKSTDHARMDKEGYYPAIYLENTYRKKKR